ncbi:MAG: protein-L-isoaspartate(D-aspartate) O-methyltransferase [Rhodobacteraceae bacterium]|nr:protein-L-isoaspartate(D-aspartate) O-methyltransferase [Paracoccaceae bacterium]
MKQDNPELQQLIRIVNGHGVGSDEVLAVMGGIDRRLFVADTLAAMAFEDMPLPIERGQTISQPTIVGLMTQALELDREQRVLEIGTGSGYQTLVLSHLSKYVYSIERHRKLAVAARRIVIEGHRRKNVTISVGDGSKGMPDAAPFDRIIVTAASEDVPPLLLDQLKVGGTMVLPVARSEMGQRLLKIDKSPDGPIYSDLGGVRFVPLVEGVEND